MSPEMALFPIFTKNIEAIKKLPTDYHHHIYVPPSTCMGRVSCPSCYCMETCPCSYLRTITLCVQSRTLLNVVVPAILFLVSLASPFWIILSCIYIYCYFFGKSLHCITKTLFPNCQWLHIVKSTGQPSEALEIMVTFFSLEKNLLGFQGATRSWSFLQISLISPPLNGLSSWFCSLPPASTLLVLSPSFLTLTTVSLVIALEFIFTMSINS